MKSNILLIVGAIFIISVIVTLNLFVQQNYQAEMAEQFNKQQLLLAESISKNIHRSIEHLKSMSHAFAGLLGGTDIDRGAVRRFVTESFSEAEDIRLDLRIFEGGSLTYSSTDRPAGEGDLALLERAESLGPGESLVVDRGEEQKLTLVTPVFGGAGRRGALIFDISIGSINRKFLAPIQSGSKGFAWMMDADGTLLYHPTQTGMIGKNLNKVDASCFECHKSFEVERKILESGGTGVRSYIAPFGEDKIIAFSRIDLAPGSFWIAVVSIPYSEVTASIRKSMKLHSILVISIFMTTAAAAFMLVLINRKRIKAEERARHEAELERYASELEEAVKKQTLELISEKEKLDAIVGALEVGLFLADHNKNIIWVNKTLKDWVGEEKVKALTLEEIYGGDEVQSSTSMGNMMQEVVHHTLGRRKGYFQITTTTLSGPDGRMQLLGLIHDITEIKKFEEQMAHSEKLASIGRLTAGIAHEIGNPLTSVFSFLQILREMEKDDFKKENLDTILFHINRIADIVRQLSGLSKLPPASFKEVQINDLIASSLGLLQYDKRAKPITVVKELGALPEIVTDANQLTQVFVNFILNAVDAMPEGGTLTIRTMDDTDSISVEVEDTGVGIPRENLQRVFDPFFTTKDKGTGLGLSVSYGIIRRLGGEIAVESEEGRGTTFRITVPKRRHEQADTRG
ncbi:MAG: sensor histidine kinase [Thermodesulfovibrionales bacterium]